MIEGGSDTWDRTNDKPIKSKPIKSREGTNLMEERIENKFPSFKEDSKF